MKTITLTAPQGYEFTGEFRAPHAGEPYYDGGSATQTLMYSHIVAPILRRIEPRRIYHKDNGNWFPIDKKWPCGIVDPEAQGFVEFVEVVK